MIRVLHVFATLNMGGAESRIMDVYRRLDREKTQFDFLILTDERCYFEDEILALGGRVYRASHPAKNLLRHIRELLRILTENQFQAIHSHTSYFSGLVVLVGRLSGVPFRVCHARNQSIGTRSWRVVPFFRIGRLFCNLFATTRFAISRGAGEFLFGKNSQFDVVPNAFDFQGIKSSRRALPFKEGGREVINLVMVARLEKVKNHLFALSVLDRLIRIDKREARLHLIGVGAEESRIRKAVSELGLNENIVFWGRRSDVKDLLCEFDCLILPSHNEGLGVAVLEGQAAGLPCIASTGVPPEADIGLGLVHRLPLDVEKWALLIQQLDQFSSPDKPEINSRFCNLGYQVEDTSAIYLKSYGIVL